MGFISYICGQNVCQTNTIMLGNFSYYNPTKLYFGDESLNFLKDELKGYGPVVLLNYGSGSVKRNGIYDQVVAILKEAGKTIVENPGVMTNPTLEKLNEGVRRVCRKRPVFSFSTTDCTDSTDFLFDHYDY